jgi:hypothetical protein
MNNQEMKGLAVSYTLQVLFLALLLYFPIRFWGTDGMQVPSLVGFLFVLFFYAADGWIWYWVASRHKKHLTSFFTGTSGFRFLLALAILGIYYKVSGGAEMTTFLLVLMIYYLVLLIHHSVFFSRVSKRL